MKTATQIRYDASLLLEDPDGKIFGTDVLSQQANKGLTTISQYVPYQSKESRFFAAAIPEINISGIPKLNNVFKAEYVIDQTPRTFRNVSTFGDTLTVETDLTPTIADEVYLFCNKYHTLVDPPSTLTGATSADTAINSSTVALDGLGTGVIMAGTLVYFTGIAGEYLVTADVEIDTAAATIAIEPPLIEAVPNNTVCTFKYSTLTPELENILTELMAGYAALNHVGDGRTQIAAGITAIADVNTAVDDMAARIAQVLTDIASQRTNLMAMLSAVTTAIGLGNARTDQQVTDISNARIAFNAQETAIETAIAAIAARITQSINDLTSGRALVNTIVTGAGAQSQFVAYATGELNAAAAKLNEAVGRMRQGSNLANLLYNAANHEASTANGYFTEARADLSEYSLAITGYGNAASHELSATNAILSKAGGYLREINARLSVSNIILQYSRWGQGKINQAMQELINLQKPVVFATYPRS